MSVDNGLYHALRGLPGGDSLARLLARRRGVPNRMALPSFTVKQILRWADDYYRVHGRWPSRDHGPIDGAGGATWNAVDLALKKGLRSLAGGDSLAELLDRRRRKKAGASPKRNRAADGAK